ncbi:MAG: fucose isomerase [Candidatus Thorarchaeota archaeon]|nr:MAG: fucose isomerase [Candidatus Thorarchaeota archaeon]
MAIKIVPFFSALSPDGLRSQVLDRIQQEGVRIVSSAEELAPKESVCIFIGTGGTENDVVEFLENARSASQITILSYDERNSLPASMEIRAYLQRRGVEATIVHEPLNGLRELLGRWVKCSQIIEHLKGSRLGLVGQSSSWLIASDVIRRKVAKKWGLEIVDIPIQELMDDLPETSNNGFKTRMDDFQSHAICQSVSSADIGRAGAVAQRLAEIVNDAKLDAVTVQCFTLLQETGTSGCVALSSVNDVRDLVAGCEGDIPATFTMLLAKMLTGLPSFMANVASVDLELNTAVFAHCTVPLSMTEGYETTSHFETGKSVGIRGRLPLSEVTVFKVFGEDLGEHWVSSGTIIENLVNESGCRTQIRVAMDEPVDYFLEESLANHHIIILGDHVEVIAEFFEFLRRK